MYLDLGNYLTMKCFCFLLISLPPPPFGLCGFQYFFVYFFFTNESKDLSYPGTGIFWSSGTLKGIGEHFMDFCLFLSMFRNWFSSQALITSLKFSAV